MNKLAVIVVEIVSGGGQLKVSGDTTDAAGDSDPAGNDSSETAFHFISLWPPYVIGGPLYFCPVVSFFLSSFFFFLA